MFFVVKGLKIFKSIMINSQTTMSQESLEYLFNDEELGKKLDEFGQDTQSPEILSLAHQYNIVAEFYIDPKSERLASIFYEARHHLKVNKFRVALSTAGHMNFPTATNLAGFINNYVAKLEHENLLADNEEKMLGKTPADGILYRQTYHNLPEPLEKISVILSSLMTQQ
jgi:hypothetical protein|tara:strand:- start:584 stop:1090 length:507 start_codon:yes stop_codon:yes gene_type:complete